MDESSQIIKDFEYVLKNNAKKTHLSLYGASKSDRSRCFPPENSYRAQDIITSVNKQIKDIQRADTVMANKQVKKVLNKNKKSSFLPVNMLPREPEVINQKAANRFETQCVSDTQLIDIIDNAEAIANSNNGITQEFDSTFYDNDNEKCIVGENNTTTSNKPVVHKDNIGVDSENVALNSNLSFKGASQNEFNELFTDKISCNKVTECDISVSQDREVLNKVAGNVSLKEDKTHARHDVISPSPIFQVSRSKSHSPLVFDLGSFEKFEKIALPIIEENSDLTAAKLLINSQIIGRELLLQANVKPRASLVNEQTSPVLKVSSELLKITKHTEANDALITNNNKDENPTQRNKEINDTFLQDEILFSSDEEEEYVHKELQDIPLTCALETSFYEQPDVLDKTMFVGFQTASNKSIQITTDSFTKAKSVLDEIEKDVASSTSLADLVDSLSSKYDNPNIHSTKTHAETGPGENIDNNFKKDEAENRHCIKTEKELSETEISIEKEIEMLKRPDKRKFDGFMTASKKKIKLSDIALARCKRVFQDINLEDDFEADRNEALINKEDKQDLCDNANIDEDIMNEFSRDMSMIEKEEGETVRFVGFETASKKKIKISDAALAKTKNLFDDIDDDFVKKCDRATDTKEFCGFKTASSKTIKISNAALMKGNELFKDIIEGKDEKPISNYKLQNEIGKADVFVGFKTANNKEIKISEQALLKTKDIFKDVEKEPVKNQENEINQTDSKDCNVENDMNELQEDLSTVFEHDILDIELQLQISSKPDEKTFLDSNKINDINPNENLNSILKETGSKILFRTANNMPINVSNSAIEKSKKIFENVDNIDGFTSKDKLNLPSTHQVGNKETENVLDKVLLFKEIDEPTFEGFKTANNKPINISSEALAKSRTLFQDIDCEDKIDSFTTTYKNIDSCTTKSIKPVMLKEKSTHKTESSSKHKELFKDVDVECYDLEKVTAKSDVPNNNLNVFKGFQTASNKHIGVSSEALARSKAIFQDLDQEYNDINQAKNDTPFEGFHTASNKRINVSSEALLRSKLVFKDIDNDELQSNTADDSSKKDTGTFKGFQTANKKPVAVSAEALARSKILFQDIDQDFDKPNLKNTAETFVGFKTANQKPIPVSSEAVVKSKALFKDIDNVDNTFEEKLSKFKGFQTGNKKPVLVSEEALAKSKKIFEEIKENEMNSKQFCGFQTASNKQVKISEDSLKKTREIFQDIDLTQREHKENILEEDLNKIKVIESMKMRKENSKEYKEPLKKLGVINQIENKPKLNTQLQKHTIIPVDNNLDKLIDTQIINDFQETLCTEDFHDDNTRRSKRSGSPIISCPKAKRRKKFETPYRSGGNIAILNDLKKASEKPDSVILFNNDYKKNKRLKLSHLRKVEEKYDDENSKITVEPYILNFYLDTFQDFEFFGQRNDLNNKKLTIEDIKDIFVKAVNKKLIPIGWIENHIKLIVWKLLSYEIKFPHTLYEVCTVKNVLDQLKYRYDRELYNAERPAIRKILEKDDVASKTIVFCVAGIIADGVNVKSVTNISSNVELVLTDGWYCIKAVIDKMLTKLVYDEKITVGCKIVTNGAELLNCEQGVAPWEDTASVRLKLSGNSTRRARWDARLGYHGNAAILTRLSSVKLDGGKVSKLRLFVARVYPMLYVEKFEDGSTVTRSERLEHIHQVKYESERQTMMEKLYEEVEKELSDQESQDSTASQLAGKHLKSSTEYRISESQVKSLEDRTNRKREKLLQNIQERVRKKIEEKGMNVNRNVVTLLKLRVAGIDDCGANVIVTKGLMSIWKPNDLITEIVKEGAWIEVMNVVPTAMRYSEIQLSAGRQSIFNQSKHKENEKIKPYTNSLQRKCYHIKNLAQNPTMSTDYNEIDTLGLIFQIDEETNQPFQNMYLTDTEKNIICINFWGGLKKFGFQNVLNVGQVIYGTNLQKRAGNTRKSVPHFRVTEFTNFTKTPKNVVVRNLIDDMEKIFSGMDRKKYCNECVIFKNNYTTKCTTENISPYRFNNDHNLTKNKVFIDSPLAKCDDNFNLTGLDFESTFKQTDTQDMSPKVLQRKKIVKQKIARLKMIGEPPPLSPLNIINKSKTAFNSYRSPLAQTSVARTKNEQTNNDINIQSSPVIQTCNRSYQHNVSSVKKSTNSSISKEYQSSPLIESNVDTTKIHKNVNSEILPSSVQSNVASTKIFYQNSRIESDVLQSSPVFSMNRTYVKNVIPVKLNFSNADDSLEEVVDHFAEEFDGSPPLSLD